MACPYCTSELRGTFTAKIDKPSDFESEDLTVHEDHSEAADDLAIAVNTDLPVHVSLVGQRAEDAWQSPFIQATSIVGDKVPDLMRNIERMRALRGAVFPHVRQALAAFSRGDLGNVQFNLRKLPGAEQIDFLSADPVDVLGGAISELYSPFEDEELRRRAVVEWMRILAEARDANGQATAEVFVDFDASPFREHQSRVIDSCISALSEPSAIFPAMWAEEFSARAPGEEFRVMRDDFDVLKVRYQDIFELGSRSLAFTARVANLARRGNASDYVDGVSRTLHKALNKTTSFQREAWLVDFPAATELYNAIKRHTRNDIGHRLVRYDFLKGELAFDDGHRENYLQFLVDYLNAVRLSHYLWDVCETVWHARPIATAASETPRRVD